MHIRSKGKKDLIFDINPRFLEDSNRDASDIDVRIEQVTDPDGNLLFEEFLPMVLDYDTITKQFSKRNISNLLSRLTDSYGTQDGKFFRVVYSLLVDGVVIRQLDVPLIDEED